ncbi:TPA: type III-A CRISPR-associated RAMP protein Csm3 [bacterium]|nr:type III-A CRISPR-associated RAMP protein Csm3 [bacterium]
MKLVKYKSIKGKILLITGLHIGAGQESTQIGGLDNPIIRSASNNLPYIPGSSLKGKMRSLMELYTDRVGRDGAVHAYSETCENGCPICYVFGSSAAEGAPTGPGRLVVRDSFIDLKDEENKRILEESKGLPFSEEKTEISINRITSKVERALRKTERVPAGVKFDLDISVRIFGTDNENEIWDNVLLGLALVQKDALGGSGSRGYGKVEFIELTDEDGNQIELPKV